MAEIKLNINGAIKFKIDRFRDNRGYFCSLNNHFKILNKYKFVSQSISYSKKNVVRGMHYQKKNTQGHLIHLIKGKILDIGIDLRKKSPTFKKLSNIILDANKINTIFLPPGVAHGFICLEKENIIYYNLTNSYDNKNESRIKFDENFLYTKYLKYFKRNLIYSLKDKKAKLKYQDIENIINEV